MHSGMPCGRTCPTCGAIAYAYYVSEIYTPPDYIGLDNPVFHWEFICWNGHEQRALPEQLSLFDE